MLLRYAIDRAEAKFFHRYHAKLSVGKSAMQGVDGIYFSAISLVPPGGDTLLVIDSVFAEIRIWPLFAGRLRFLELDIFNLRINAVAEGSRNNFSFLLEKPEKKSGDSAAVKKNYAERVRDLTDKIFLKIPAKARFSNLRIAYSSDSLFFNSTMPLLDIKDGQLRSKVLISDTQTTAVWAVRGEINVGKKKITATILPEANSQHPFLPLLYQKWKLRTNFSGCSFSFQESGRGEDGVLLLHGSASVSNLLINHPRVSPGNVVFPTLAINYRVRIGEDFFQLDSISSVKINEVELHPFLRLHPQKPEEVDLRVILPPTDARKFFSALPEGIFSVLAGIETEGTLSYRMNLLLNMQQVDSVQFSSALTGKNFRILHYGNTYLPRINDSFEYTAYERGVPVKKFIVGTENASYAPLDQIAPFLKNAVLTSEDGSFFWHRGFNEESFRKAIAVNIKEKRFARGASTISMQLVKNVFLNRNKNIARKLEEALIVWLIENNRLSGKERMFEVYLNIIEWGPGIYGIGEAAEFYFKKRPSELTLAESIFLASIVPHPKWFKYSFDEQGNLKGYLNGYYKLLSGIMAQRKLITEEEFNALVPQIKLEGAAKKMVLPADSILSDSLFTEEPE